MTFDFLCLIDLDCFDRKSDEIQRQINENKEELGDILYEKVAEIETESCAQITGTFTIEINAGKEVIV